MHCEAAMSTAISAPGSCIPDFTVHGAVVFHVAADAPTTISGRDNPVARSLNFAHSHFVDRLFCSQVTFKSLLAAQELQQRGCPHAHSFVPVEGLSTNAGSAASQRASK
jgi:hypothetical protein